MMRKAATSLLARRAGTLACAVVLACGLMVPSLAFATVKVDQTELAQGDNAVGGGTATLVDATLDMVDVVASEFSTDEDLTVNFNGGNEIDDVVVVGSADVELNFEGENEVEDIYAGQNADVTINANGHNDFEEVNAFDNANVTILVTGENDFESIVGSDNAAITIKGTDCQKKDTINLGEDEGISYIATSGGNLIIDHVTINLESEFAGVGSDKGNMVIDTSKIAGEDDNEFAEIFAGGTMLVKESVIDVDGTVSSKGQMTINHSDVKVEKSDYKYGDNSPYRVYSETGVELIDEENGEVKEGEIDGKKVYYVDTDDGEDVDLEADGDPAYYKCRDDDGSPMPKTGDGTNPLLPAALALMGVMVAAIAAKRQTA